MSSAWSSVAFVVALGVAAATVACTNAHSYDCNEACNLYRDCVAPDYDTATCETRCETMSGSDSAYGMRATACHNCLGSAACSDAGTFTCADTCDMVVP